MEASGAVHFCLMYRRDPGPSLAKPDLEIACRWTGGRQGCVKQKKQLAPDAGARVNLPRLQEAA